MQSGKSGSEYLAHMSEEGRHHAEALVQVILLAALHGNPNAKVVISAVLDDPCYMVAFDRFKADRGFSSRDAALNAMMRELACHYGLIDEGTRCVKTRGQTTHIRTFRGDGH